MNGFSYPTHSRIIVNGIPYYIDTANNLYAYGLDTTGPRIQIGTYSTPPDPTVTLTEGWSELIAPRLPAYRAAAASARLRIDPAATKQTRTKRSGISKTKASS